MQFLIDKIFLKRGFISAKQKWYNEKKKKSWILRKLDSNARGQGTEASFTIISVLRLDRKSDGLNLHLGNLIIWCLSHLIAQPPLPTVTLRIEAIFPLTSSLGVQRGTSYKPKGCVSMSRKLMLSGPVARTEDIFRNIYGVMQPVKLQGG